MADKNQRNRIDNDAGEAVGTGVGAFTGDKMASALDPFGSVASAVAGGALDNMAEGVTVDHDNHGSKTRD
ncbi:hypothetical protein [Bacillus sp. OK048]|uniref:hypothetical protein n=1 Tax=Bacillus sp. OK048 TaxID=1882761 RepID=UPI00088551E9|nr:hypothetical protein [Bacillus sp. OK048]SDN92890.1 hypothetical protein SAMN05443253_1284 [Bacillus sp. OK048]